MSGPTYSSNTMITGTLLTNKPDNKFIFCEHYRCKIQKTQEHAYVRQIGMMNVPGGMDQQPYQTQLSNEEIFNVKLTEGMLVELIDNNVDQIKQKQMREKDERLNDLYNAYITMYHLLK